MKRGEKKKKKKRKKMKNKKEKRISGMDCRGLYGLLWISMDFGLLYGY